MDVGYNAEKAGGKLSIVIPCYNEVGTIEEIVKRVKNSAYQNKEIILVDDCSTDGSKEVIRKRWKN